MKKVFLVIVAIFALMVFMPTANATAKPYQPFTTGIVMEIPEDAVIPPYLTPDHLFLAGTVTQKTTEGITLRFFYYEDRNYSYIAYDTDGTPREIPPYMEATIWDGQKISFVGLQFLSGEIAVN